MFPLTDFSLSELRILSKMIDKKIKKINAFTNHLIEILPEGGETYNNIMERNSKDLPELREMHVRVLSAIEIVKQRETIQAN